MSASSRHALLMEWLVGDRTASASRAGDLYRTVYSRLHAGLGRRASDAEDATQATFLAAVENRWRIRKGLAEYLSGVSRMKLREHYRRRDRRRRTVSLAELEELPDERRGADAIVEIDREVDRLVAALQGLPPADQRCLALVYGRDMRNVEAAAALGQPEVEFNNRIGHARARLRRALASAPCSAPERSMPSFHEWVESALRPLDHTVPDGSPPPADPNRFL